MLRDCCGYGGIVCVLWCVIRLWRVWRCVVGGINASVAYILSGEMTAIVYAMVAWTMWAGVTCVHGMGMCLLQCTWMWYFVRGRGGTSVAASFAPCGVLAYWRASGVCHLSLLEAALSPAGWAVYHPIPAWGVAAVTVNAVVAAGVHFWVVMGKVRWTSIYAGATTK